MTTAAQLMDVSREGLLVLADDTPPEQVKVQVRILQPVMTDWVEACVAESRDLRLGPTQLRLVFPGGLPGWFFTLAASRLETLN